MIHRLASSPPRSGTGQLERGLIFLLVFAFASGALAHLLPAVLPVTRYTTDPLLLVVNVAIVFSLYQRHGDHRLLWWLLGAYVFTFTVEALGVATGRIFGVYHYGATMRWQWLGVPFVIALNWAVLTLAANELARRFTKSVPLTALLAGCFLALYDVAIEPVAIKLDYWQWENGTIPLQNYVTWALVAALISWPLQRLKIRFQSPVLLVYFWAQLFFFLVLNLGL